MRVQSCDGGIPNRPGQKKEKFSSQIREAESQKRAEAEDMMKPQPPRRR